MTTMPAAPPSSPRPSRPAASGDRLPMTPGRGVALLLGVPLVLVFMAGGAYSIVQNLGRASFPISSYQVPVTSSGLAISLDGGNGTVRGVPAGTAGTTATAAWLSGTVSYDLGRPTVRRGDGSIGLDCPRIDLGNCSLDATVDVPVGIPLTVATGGGDLSASGLTGDDTLSTNGGNLTLTGATGSAGPVTLTSGGGDITVAAVSAPALTMSADGGNVDATGVTASSVSVSTGGGDITLTITKTPPRDLRVNTDGGNVTIVVPPGYYIVTTNTGGGNLNHAINSSPGATNVIDVSSGGGDISLSES